MKSAVDMHKRLYGCVFVMAFITFGSILYAGGFSVTFLSISLSATPIIFAALFVYQHAKRDQQIRSTQDREADKARLAHVSLVMQALEQTNQACSRTFTLWEQKLAFCRDDSKQ